MSDLFRNTLSWPGWLAVGAVPLGILALYFLKLKRVPLEVPSTFLWTKAIEDLHVNSLWQRFRRSLLLLLQLLVALLAIFALLRPGWHGEALSGSQFIFLVDRSASMSARDAAGASRLDAAKQRLDALIEQLDSDMSAMIIAFDDQADVLQEFTDNHRLLHEATARILPTAKATNVRSALQLADGFANPNRVRIEEGGMEVDAAPQQEVELYILSDGRFGAVADFSLGNLKPKFLPFGSPQANNLAITALSVARNPAHPQERQAFFQAANFGDEPQKAVVEMRLGAELLDAKELTIPAGDVAGVTFDLEAASEGSLTAKLAPQPAFADALPLDDVAYAVVEAPRQSRVLLVTPGNRALEFATSTESVLKLSKIETAAPAALKTDALRKKLASQEYDLVIYDQCAPEKAADMPQANTLFLGRLPPVEPWREKSSAKPIAAPQIIDWQRSHPLLALVELGNVVIAESYVVTPPAGGTVLVDSTRGSIAAIAPRENFEDAVVGFEIVSRNEQGDSLVNTNWPRMHSFPNFWWNVVDYLAGASAASQVVNHPPGRAVELDLAERPADLRVRLPDGKVLPVTIPVSGKPSVAQTDQLGVYQVLAGDRVLNRFAINTFDRQESDVRLRSGPQSVSGVQEVQEIKLGYADVAATANSPVRKELWTWLLLAALAVLVLEWYIYNRRVYV